ncbi:MAG TPA: NADH-quinone oxidoreductase subunit M [Terracidiphilus sp.]
MDAINNSILTWILLVPIAGAILIALLPDRGKLAAWVGLITTLLTFGLTLHLPAHFIPGQPGFQFEVNRPWIDLNGSAEAGAHFSGIAYHVGVDGLSMWLVVLSGLLGPVGVLASWNAIKERKKVFYSLFMVQQTAMFGVFIALDLMVYYGFWELTLVPMAVLIAMYGRKNGPAAATKFFLFTFIPSAPLLVAILWLYVKTGTFSFTDLRVILASSTYSGTAMFWVALAFLVAFAVKVPVFPLHGWLADSFSEAPVALSMVIAGKLGLYSMIRFHVGLFPTQAKAMAPTLIALTVIGVIYGACLALVQRDFWKLIAFATVSHFSLITLGVYGFTLAGRDGAVFQTLNEGVIEGALFVLLGVLDTRYHTSQIASYGGVAARLPRTATFFVITGLAMAGLPLMNGFVGEFLILSGTFTGVSKGWAIVATLTVILGAAYVLSLVQRIFYGPESPLAAAEPVLDLHIHEWVALVPLAVLMLVMGVQPNKWLNAIEHFEGPLTIQQPLTPSGPPTARIVLTSTAAEAK